MKVRMKNLKLERNTYISENYSTIDSYTGYGAKIERISKRYCS